MKKQGTGKRKPFQWIIAAEIIVCYMAVLTVVSYARGPERYETADKPLLVTEEFVSFAGQPAEPGGVFPMENEAQGTAEGYLAELDLTVLELVQVSFRAECPEEYAGGTLFVDLCNGELGYDYPENEFQMTMQTGSNEADFVLDPGHEHPDTAQIGFFTLDKAGYKLEDIQIHALESLPKVSNGMKPCVAACFLLLGVTACVMAVYRADRHADRRFVKIPEE